MGKFFGILVLGLVISATLANAQTADESFKLSLEQAMMDNYGVASVAEWKEKYRGDVIIFGSSARNESSAAAGKPLQRILTIKLCQTFHNYLKNGETRQVTLEGLEFLDKIERDILNQFVQARVRAFHSFTEQTTLAVDDFLSLNPNVLSSSGDGGCRFNGTVSVFDAVTGGQKQLTINVSWKNFVASGTVKNGKDNLTPEQSRVTRVVSDGEAIQQ